jgi:hypothetical protein
MVVRCVVVFLEFDVDVVTCAKETCVTVGQFERHSVVVTRAPQLEALRPAHGISQGHVFPVPLIM